MDYPKYPNHAKIWIKLRNLDVYNNKSVETLPSNLNCAERINEFLLNRIPSKESNVDRLNHYKNNLLIEGCKTRLTEASEQEVWYHLQKLNSNTTGVDRINLKMLQFSFIHCSSTLTKIINQSITQEIFPNLWKTSKVIPVPKMKPPKCYKDLRPASILSPISKLLKSIINKQIKTRLKSCSILAPSQSHFRANFNTATALTALNNEVLSA